MENSSTPTYQRSKVKAKVDSIDKIYPRLRESNQLAVCYHFELHFMEPIHKRDHLQPRISSWRCCSRWFVIYSHQSARNSIARIRNREFWIHEALRTAASSEETQINKYNSDNQSSLIKTQNIIENDLDELSVLIEFTLKRRRRGGEVRRRQCVRSLMEKKLSLFAKPFWFCNFNYSAVWKGGMLWDFQIFC